MKLLAFEILETDAKPLNKHRQKGINVRGVRLRCKIDIENREFVMLTTSRGTRLIEQGDDYEFLTRHGNVLFQLIDIELQKRLRDYEEYRLQALLHKKIMY